MALHTFGSTSASALRAIQFSEAVSDADIASISQTVTNDIMFGSVLSGAGVGAQGILATGTTSASINITTLAHTAGGPLAAIQVGQLVLGVGIVPGTYVASIVSGTAVTLSQATTSNTTLVPLCFVPTNYESTPNVNRSQQLIVPMRGVLKILPNDVIAVDPNTGAVILVPGNAVSASGSIWTFT